MKSQSDHLLTEFARRIEAALAETERAYGARIAARTAENLATLCREHRDDYTARARLREPADYLSAGEFMPWEERNDTRHQIPATVWLEPNGAGWAPWEVDGWAPVLGSGLEVIMPLQRGSDGHLGVAPDALALHRAARKVGGV